MDFFKDADYVKTAGKTAKDKFVADGRITIAEYRRQLLDELEEKLISDDIGVETTEKLVTDCGRHIATDR